MNIASEDVIPDPALVLQANAALEAFHSAQHALDAALDKLQQGTGGAGTQGGGGHTELPDPHHLADQIGALDTALHALSGSVQSFQGHAEQHYDRLPHEVESVTAATHALFEMQKAAHPKVDATCTHLARSVESWGADAATTLNEFLREVEVVGASLDALRASAVTAIENAEAATRDSLEHTVSTSLDHASTEIQQNLSAALNSTVENLEGLRTRIASDAHSRCERVVTDLNNSLTQLHDHLCDYAKQRFSDELRGRIDEVISSALGDLIEEIEAAIADSTVSSEVTAALGPYLPELIALYHLADTIERLLHALKEFKF